MIDFRQAVYTALALSSHISDPELHQDAVDLFLRNNRRKITSAGSYSRDMIYIENSKRVESEINIIRFRYKNDPSSTTHSVSSDILIPFGSYTVRFVLHVLNAFYKHDQSVSELCASFSIAVSTLYDWKSFLKLMLCLISMQYFLLQTFIILQTIPSICSRPSVPIVQYDFTNYLSESHLNISKETVLSHP